MKKNPQILFNKFDHTLSKGYWRFEGLQNRYFLKNVFKKCYSKINVQSMEKTQLLNTLIFISNKQYPVINQVALKYSFWKSHNISMIYCTIHIINMKLYSWTILKCQSTEFEVELIEFSNLVLSWVKSN